ncbi:hypothetical protein GGI20_000252 [Coemansia sp. BCRC 34301]|nr:hypothetical protein GGI20_000252 [Coemansia sp. BCRC 34301]
MNFWRKKLRRDAAVSDVVSVQPEKKLGEKAKRRSYFMMRTSSSPLLSQSDVPEPPPPAVLADTAASARVVASVDGSIGTRIQRRRSIPGVAYLMAAKLIIAGKAAADDTSIEADISMPERAVVHPGSLHAVAPRACKSDEHAAAGCMAGRRASDCSSSSTASSSDDNNSDSSGGGGDSDDTLAPTEAAADSNLADVVTLAAAGDGSIASSVRSYYSCSAVQAVDAPRQISGSQPLSGVSPAEGQQTQAPPQRRQLRLGRWRAASTCLPPQGEGDGIGRLAALAMRPGRMSLGSAPCQQQQCGEEGSKKARWPLGSLGHHQLHASLELSSGVCEAARPRVAHRKLSGALGKLLLTPPPPSAAEQAKLDAWAADDDEFSASDYDLSGTYFELAPVGKQAVLGEEALLLGSGGRRKHMSECTTPESRLSSTSTVVDEGAASALGPEQYKRIFVSSARKLQLQGGRRGMSCVVHIKTMMTKASEHYVVVSGGRSLDAYRISRDMLADLCLSAAAEDCAKERLPPPVTEYPPTRRRSVGSSAQLAQRRPRRAVDTASSSVVEVPLSSPPPLSPSAEIADAALARIATDADAAELAEYGMGDLVSLCPTVAAGSDGEAQDYCRPTYRRYRRRRASKWGQLSSTRPQSGVAGAIAAL